METSEQHEADVNLTDILALDMEYRLTVATRLDCNCAEYLIRRRDVLIPELLRVAKENGNHPENQVVIFTNRLHAKLCEGNSDGD